MPAPVHSPPPWRLLVSSCDNYNDTWPWFFHFLFKYWPDVPTPVYLVSNHTRYDDPRVRTLTTGPDHAWSDTLRKALAQVPEEWLVFILDDFLLKDPVDSRRVQEAWSQFHRLDGVYLSADNFHKPGQRIPESWFCQVTPETLYVGLNATFWKKSHLASVVHEPGLNIWKAENRLKALARAAPRGHFFIEPGTPSLVNYVESIKGYFWKPMAIEFLAQHQLKPDLRRRPCPAQGRDPLSRSLRSLLKYRMRLGNWLNAKLAGRLRPSVIKPLPS